MSEVVHSVNIMIAILLVGVCVTIYVYSVRGGGFLRGRVGVDGVGS